MQRSQYRVAIIDSERGSYVHQPDIEQSILAQVATTDLIKVDSSEELIGQIEDVDAIISWHTIPLPDYILQRLTKCRHIVRAATGFDNIDIDTAARCGIPVSIIPDYGIEEVADHAMALILCSIRNIFSTHKHSIAGGWKWQSIGQTRRVRGQRLLIVGLGRIGTAVAVRAKAFGFEIGFFDPYLATGIEKSLALKRYDSLHEAISLADVISLHVPLTNETKNMIGSKEISLMSSKSILVNTSRGPVIEAMALEQAIGDQTLAGVALDVLPNEPNVPQLFRTAPNVILTAHSGFFSENSLHELREKSALAVLATLKGQSPKDVVNSVTVEG